MTTSPGQEPRPGFTPRGGQPRPASRGDSRWPDDAGRRGEVEDYWLAGRQPGSRGPGERPSFTPAHGSPRSPAGNRSTDAPGPGRPRPQATRGWPDDRARLRNESTIASGRFPDDTIVRSGLLATPGLRWVGAWSAKRAASVLLVVTLLGMIATIVTKHEPGFMIGLATVIGSIVAAFGARRGAVHKLIPLPALSYLVTTTLAGAAHDRGVLNDTKEYITNFLTWIGGAFTAVVGATVLVVVIALARWLLSKVVVAGNPAVAGRGAPAGRPGNRAAASLDPDPWDGSRGDREPRDSRDRRDPWVDRGSRPSSQGNRADPWGGRGRRADSDARDPWAAVDRPGDRERGQRGDRGPWRDDRGSRGDGRGRGDRDPWGGASSGNGSGNGHRDPRNQGNPGSRRDPRDGWGKWDDGSRGGSGQGPRRYGDSRDARDPRDPRRPRPADDPRNTW